MSEYQPGTVAVATVLGQAGCRVSRYDGGWARLDDPDLFYNDMADRAAVTDIRPLVVLDLDEVNSGRLVAILRGVDKWDSNPDCKFAGRIADQIEAQTKPPKPSEPEATGSKVRAKTFGHSDVREFVRVAPGLLRDPDDWCWVDIADGLLSRWSHLTDVEVIREGVES